MAVDHSPVFVQTPGLGVVAFVNADAANAKKTIVTAGVNGSKVVSLTVASTDSSARIAQVWLTRSATSYLLASLSVPITSGSDGTTPVVNLMNATIWPGLPVDNVAQRFFYLQSGDTLQISFTTQVTSAKEIDLAAVYSNF